MLRRERFIILKQAYNSDFDLVDEQIRWILISTYYLYVYYSLLTRPTEVLPRLEASVRHITIEHYTKIIIIKKLIIVDSFFYTRRVILQKNK